MFTGLIAEVGKIVKVEKGIDSAKLTIKSHRLMSDIKVGDSIAVNGVCLTVTSYDNTMFTVDVMPETMSKSNIRGLSENSLVNLEPALRVGDRFGGHIVTGHIDGIGTISSMIKDDNATRVRINMNEELNKLIIRKGSVAVDGISLTVADVYEDGFQVSIIPLTGKDTTLLNKKIRDKVNIECDIIGKYVEKLMANDKDEVSKKSRVDRDLLLANGFI
ncbi:riboflavin synthase subunit alpha [Vallitalea longa]|uniref:Riboflavin synthase n=1 Tax=Vallitalea longa TaxID=2936439 RepID=A0A9W6DGV6_9FIRM|nr:riboflavin synthase [Vallitalea longa]GKX32025.1 riboflavin synthase subunit alpha [Vallitalea longa]